MQQRILRAHFLTAALAAVFALPSSAVVQNQIDSFESGTTANWTIGQTLPTGPTNIATGGPAGADDNYLRVTGTGMFGAGGRLVVFNGSQWAGDYWQANVGSIRMDVNNTGPNDLSLRLMIAEGLGQFFNNGAISTDAITVPAGSGWTEVEFPIGLADLTAVEGSVAPALSNAAVLWLQHNEGTSFPPDPFAGVLGVDNIEALPVPEPSATVAFGAGFALLALLARRRARRS
jgi:hypothetical protein